MKKVGVVLGRFAPLHKGHQRVIDKLISNFEVKNSLLIIGSSDSYNARTPYTFKERRNMIKAVYPTLKVANIADTNNYNDHFKTKDLKFWLDKLKTMQNKFNAKFIFYAGSDKDIDYLKEDFKTLVVVNRRKNSLKISATKIRELLANESYDNLEKYLDRKIIAMAISGYKKFKHSQSSYPLT